MAALDTYLQFILDYAPYFYYIPGTGVDTDAGRGVAAAAFSIDFLYEAYNSGKFPTKETDIYNKIVSLADWILTQQSRYAEVAPSTVGTSTAASAIDFPFQRKCFWANGRFWVFWCDGSDMVYATSLDGVTGWTAKTVVHAGCDYGRYFSVYFDGTFLHYAFSDATAANVIKYRRGIPNANGSITWSTPTEQGVVIEFGGANYPVICVDSSGYVWIAYRAMQYASPYDEIPYVIKSGNNDGTWGTTPDGFPFRLNETSSNLWRVSITPLTDGKMLALYAFGGVYHIKARRFDGAAWGEERTTTIWGKNSNYFSAVAEGDDVLVVFLKSTNDVYYLKYSYATDSLVDGTIVQAAVTEYSAPQLSRDPLTGHLYCFWAGSPAANHIYYKKRVAGTWDVSPTDWIDESSETLTGNYRIICFDNVYGDYVGLLYITKAAYPHNIKFDALTIQPTTAYGGFKSNETSTFYYSIDACRVIPSLLKAYELTNDADYLNAAVLAGKTFLKTMQDKQTYGGFARFIDISDVWDLKMDVECLYGLIGLKMLCSYDVDAKSQYELMMETAVGFLRTGFESLWLYYDPSDSSWHRVGLSENEIYDDPLACALIGLYDYERWSLSCEKVYELINTISASADYPGYNSSVCWAGYIDVVKRKSACDYYDAVTSGILYDVRAVKDKPSLELSVQILNLHYEEFMFWGVKFVDWSYVENKQSTITVSWLSLLLLRYKPVKTLFTPVLNAGGENVTLYSIVEAGESVGYGEGVTVKAVVRLALPDEVVIEPGFMVTDFVKVYTIIPVRHHDKIMRNGVDYEVGSPQVFRFKGEPQYYSALCRRLVS